VVLSPGEAAARLNMTVPNLVALIRRYRYRFTEIAIGGRPGDRGRNRWGLTEEQLEAIARGQERVFRESDPAQPVPLRRSPVSPDGISRLRRGRPPRE
jgi:hypothetical protein